MKKEDLIAKYNEGLADPAEVAEIERLIESGAVELTELRELDALDRRVLATEDPSPTLRADDRFYAMLAAEKRKQRGFSIQWPTWSVLMPRVAFASVILIAGFAAGYWQRQPVVSSDVSVLTKEVSDLNKKVSDLKEMTMLSLLEKESASDRMRAVSLTHEMDNASVKVTAALFATLNSDPNVNVRLAALEAIVPFSSQARVREQLIHSITLQDSPLVQVSLADLMVALQEKKSVSELQKVVDSERTPKEVREKIKKSIAVLI